MLSFEASSNTVLSQRWLNGGSAVAQRWLGGAPRFRRVALLSRVEAGGRKLLRSNATAASMLPVAYFTMAKAMLLKNMLASLRIAHATCRGRLRVDMC